MKMRPWLSFPVLAFLVAGASMISLAPKTSKGKEERHLVLVSEASAASCGTKGGFGEESCKCYPGRTKDGNTCVAHPKKTRTGQLGGTISGSKKGGSLEGSVGGTWTFECS